jgi:site-specific DNA-methyltransferase (adenine-specific)
MGTIVNPHTIVRTDSNATGTFYLADCRDVFASLPEASVDVIVTSPPYNMGIRYNTYQDSLEHEEYLEWTSAWVGAAARVLKPGGSLFLNVGTRPSDPWTALDVAQAARPHLRLQNIIHWVKAVAIDRAHTSAAAGITRDLAVGHYKPINSERYLNDCHEFVFHFTPGGSTRLDRLALGVPYQDQSNISRWRAGAEGVRCRGNTWFIPYETIQRRDKDRPHPATFPAKLPEQCIRLHGLSKVEVVMDPFTGLGSTAVACARLGVDFIGADIDELYLTEAAGRMTAAGKPHALPGRGVARMARATASATASAPPKARRA